MKAIIKFVDVGRGRRSWEFSFDGKEEDLEDAIDSEIHQKGGLVSMSISWSLDINTCKGSIFAGFHKVGEILYEDANLKSHSRFKLRKIGRGD